MDVSVPAVTLAAPSRVVAVARWLASLRHLSLLFLPAGVGVMLYYRSLTDAPASMFVVLVVSTVATIAATALTIQWLSRRAGGSARPRSESADAP